MMPNDQADDKRISQERCVRGLVKFMNINRAGKQQKACWRNQEYWRVRWEAEMPATESARQFGAYQIACQRIQGHAAGWIAGVAWAGRNQKAKSANGRT